MSLPLNIDVQQILLHMLNFVILFGGMYFLLYSPVKKFMDARAQKYADEAEKAEKALQEAEKSRAEYENKLQAAEKEIAEKKSAAQRELEKYSDDCRRAAEEKAAAIVSEAVAKAQAEKKSIVDGAKKDIYDIAVAAAEKIVYGDPGEAYDGFLDKTEKNDAEENR